MDTTRQDSTHYWDLPCGPLDLVENFTELTVSVRKKRAFNILNTLNRYIYYMVKFLKMLFLNFICTNCEENIAMDRFTLLFGGSIT